MAEPKGYLLVPVGFNPDGDIRALELTADDYLRVNVEGGTLTVAKHNILDGDTHGDSVAKAVTRGGILLGNLDPAWDRLDLGADNLVLASDGSDLSYESLASLLKAAILTANGDILIRDNGGNVVRLAKGANGEVLTLASGAASWAAAGGGLYSDYVWLADEKASSTEGGTFTSGAWRVRDINQEKSDTGGICSIAGNQITLNAGTYHCLISCPALAVNRNGARLYDTTGAAVLLTGTSKFAVNTTTNVGESLIKGVFTIGVESVLEIQHRGEITKTNDGFGAASQFQTETYTVAEFWKLV